MQKTTLARRAWAALSRRFGKKMAGLIVVALIALWLLFSSCSLAPATVVETTHDAGSMAAAGASAAAAVLLGMTWPLALAVGVTVALIAETTLPHPGDGGLGLTPPSPPVPPSGSGGTVDSLWGLLAWLLDAYLPWVIAAVLLLWLLPSPPRMIRGIGRWLRAEVTGGSTT